MPKPDFTNNKNGLVASSIQWATGFRSSVLNTLVLVLVSTGSGRRPLTSTSPTWRPDLKTSNSTSSGLGSCSCVKPHFVNVCVYCEVHVSRVRRRTQAFIGRPHRLHLQPHVDMCGPGVSSEELLTVLKKNLFETREGKSCRNSHQWLFGYCSALFHSLVVLDE